MYYTSTSLEKFVKDNIDTLTEESLYEVIANKVEFSLADIDLIDHFFREFLSLDRSIMSIRCIARLSLVLGSYSLSEIDYVFNAVFKIDNNINANSEYFKNLLSEYNKMATNAIWRRQYFRIVINSYWFPILFSSFKKLNEIEDPDSLRLLVDLMPLNSIANVLNDHHDELSNEVLEELIRAFYKNISYYSENYKRMIIHTYDIFEEPRIKRIVKKINMEKKLK